MNSKENTARVLKDQTPLVSSIWCYLGIHNYTQWSKPFRDSIYLVQERQCGKCNIHRKRKVLA